MWFQNWLVCSFDDLCLQFTTDTGHFGINQHWGYDAPVADIKNTSAGCLVGRRRQGHREFMQIIKSDRRYQIDNNYIFYTTVIAGDDLLKAF